MTQKKLFTIVMSTIVLALCLLVYSPVAFAVIATLVCVGGILSIIVYLIWVLCGQFAADWAK